MLNTHRLDLLLKALLPGVSLPDGADVTAHWCLGCLSPYLVVFPTTEDANVALRMAGFPPKGGVL